MGTSTNRDSSRLPEKRTQVKVSVAHGIASAFKAACAASNVSMAAELSRFMSGYANCPATNRRAAPNYSTRRHRRTAVNAMVKELGRILSFEEGVRDRTPDNLQASSVYEATEEAISKLEEAIDALAGY